MADGGSNDDSWENWFGGWVQTAKEKSSSALEFVKKDLAEFTGTMQREVERTSSSLTKENTEHATNKFKAGISSIFDNISKALVIPPDDDYVPMKVSADGTSLYDRGKARLHALQLDASTYLDIPRGPPEQYNMWLESFDMDEHKGEISEILVSKVEVRAFYTKLVPNEVSHADFWQRYFYRVHQLQCDEARKQALMQRADQTRGDSLSWEDDWSGGEEDDDGNQSDWEKMPRPPQSLAATEATSTQNKEPPTQSNGAHSNSSSQVTSSETSKPVSSEQHVNDEGKHNNAAHPSAQPDDPEPSSSNNLSNPNTHVKDETVSLSQNAATHTSADEADAESSCSSAHPSQPPTELWSLHIPSDTACASHPEVDNNGKEDETFPEPGSSDSHHEETSQRVEDIRQRGDAFHGAAAAGVELPPPSNMSENRIAADGACGAADSVDSCPVRSSEIPKSNLDIPAASSSSALETSKSIVDSNSELNDTIDVASAPAPELQKGCTQTVQDVSEYHNLTVETSNSEEIGQMSPEIGMRVKGDMVVVGDRGSPSTESSDTKDLALDEDWEQDFDVEVTEEDLKAAEDIAKKLGENLDAEDDDWENWE